MAAPLIGVTPMYALCFFGYGIGQKIFCNENSYKNLDLVAIGLAGATSGLFTTPILAPLERCKVVLQVQGATGGNKFKGPYDVMKHLYLLLLF
jgi:solute carrier family 25 carnitine/acylcarnitine transporter 20/29